MKPNEVPTAEEVLRDTSDWLEKVVIGLNLCPFANEVRAGGRIRFVVSEASTEEALLEALRQELAFLVASDPGTVETTLLVHPRVLHDFADFNQFLTAAEAEVERAGLEGEVQVASFHPGYQFAGTEPEDITNFTNRSPYPTLHLLRESSVDRAVEAIPDVGTILDANLATMRRLGLDGWVKLGVGPHPAV